MERCKTFNNHKQLTTQLKFLKTDIKQLEKNIISNSKTYVAHLPTKVLKEVSLKPSTKPKNLIGKALAKTANATLLKKENFITKFIISIFIKHFGKKLEDNLSQKPTK